MLSDFSCSYLWGVTCIHEVELLCLHHLVTCSPLLAHKVHVSVVSAVYLYMFDTSMLYTQ